MPCRDYDDWSGVRHAREIDKLTRMLCYVLQHVEKEKPIHQLTTEILTWWDEHKRLDAQRIKEENEDKKRKQLRKTLLNKLTKEELNALGVKKPAKSKT